MAKKVLVLKCSPRHSGNSEILSDYFVKGAKEAGHDVVELPIGKMNISPCIACYQCYKTIKPCVIDDDMQKVYPHFLSSDVIVVVAPVYYFGFPAQYKCMIDRIHAPDVTERIPAYKQTVLLMTAAGSKKDGMFDACKMEFDKVYGEWFNWKNVGTILAGDVQDRGEIAERKELQEAYRLGKSL